MTKVAVVVFDARLLYVCFAPAFVCFGWAVVWGRLLKAVPHHTRDALHTKLAEVYTLNRQFDDALESFHFAIRYLRDDSRHRVPCFEP